jgi:hypothetical protein
VIKVMAVGAARRAALLSRSAEQHRHVVGSGVADEQVNLAVAIHLGSSDAERLIEASKADCLPFNPPVLDLLASACLVRPDGRASVGIHIALSELTECSRSVPIIRDEVPIDDVHVITNLVSATLTPPR